MGLHYHVDGLRGPTLPRGRATWTGYVDGLRGRATWAGYVGQAALRVCYMLNVRFTGYKISMYRIQRYQDLSQRNNVS